MLALFILLFFLLFSWLVFFVIISAFLGFLLTRVPFVPTYAGDIEFIVKELGISSADIFYDLGSGDGRVVFLVNQLTGAKCVGFELTWWTYLLARIKRWWLQSSLLLRRDATSASEVAERLQFKNQNFFKHNWSEANYIYAYLYPPLMGRVEEKFLSDCKPGSVAVIRDFPFPNLKPNQIYYRPKKHEIYIYQAPFPNMKTKM